MLVSLQDVTTAATPLKATLPCAEPNDEPAITTDVPGSPAFGLRLPMVGRSTVKGAPALCNPRLLTTTFPLFAEAGTTTAILVSLQLLMLADCPLILTVPWFAPKLVPVTVIEVVGSALAGVRPVITGWSTLKPIAFDGPVALLTTTGPEIAPSGTKATMLVFDQLVTVAAWPLKVTVPVLTPKPWPEIVTELSGAPAVGAKDNIMSEAFSPPIEEKVDGELWLLYSVAIQPGERGTLAKRTSSIFPFNNLPEKLEFPNH